MRSAHGVPTRVGAVEAGYAVPEAAEARAPTGSWRLTLADGTVAAVVGDGGAAAADLAGGAGAVIGGRRHLALPAFVNAHDHGRAVSTLAFGAGDDALELWLPSLAAAPAIDTYLESAVAFARMARAGIAATNVTFDPRGDDRLIDHARAVARAAAEVGIRLGFCCPLLDRNLHGYGPADRLAAAHAPEDWAALGGDAPLPPLDEQIAAVEAVAAAVESPTCRVLFGPIGPIWVSPGGLAAIGEAVRRTGRQVYMHLLETPRQRAYLDREHDGAPVAALDRAGLLGPGTGFAHGVRLRPEEIALLAERGATVSVNAASNLRLRSGLAPVSAFEAAGLAWGVGLDSMSLGDAGDLLAQARLTTLLNAGSDLEPALDFAAALRALTRDGYRVIDAAGLGERGRLAPGAPADIVLLDLDRLAPDRAGAGDDPWSFLAGRGSAAHVTDLVVDGRAVLRDGVVQGVDLSALEAELAARLAEAAPAIAARRDLARRHRAALHRYYAEDGHLA